MVNKPFSFGAVPTLSPEEKEEGIRKGKILRWQRIKEAFRYPEYKLDEYEPVDLEDETNVYLKDEMLDICLNKIYRQNESIKSDQKFIYWLLGISFVIIFFLCMRISSLGGFT